MERMMEVMMNAYSTLSTPLKWLMGAHDIAVPNLQQQRECRGLFVLARQVGGGGYASARVCLLLQDNDVAHHSPPLLNGHLAGWVKGSALVVATLTRVAHVFIQCCPATGDTTCLRILNCGDPVAAVKSLDQLLHTFMGVANARRWQDTVRLVEEVRSLHCLGCCCCAVADAHACQHTCE
jgi:hypothetical protein